MNPLYRAVALRQTADAAGYSFTLHAGEIRLWQLSSKAEKEAMLDWAVGETACANGQIEMVQGERRKLLTKPVTERRRQTQSPPLLWLPLQQARLGRVGWVAGNGGLISNLKIWENVTLPLWFHAPFEKVETEQRVHYWLNLLGLEAAEFASFMAAPPATLELWQRKLAGLLRALVQMPRVLLVDAALFEDVKAALALRWIAALENFATQGRAVLVLTDKATSLPWKQIE